MQIIDNILDINEKLDKTCIAIGTFDGFHLGHMELINKMLNKAKNASYKSLIFTFSNHPLELITGEKVDYLMNSQEKLKFLEKLNPDYLILQKFDKKFAEISHEKFVKILKEKLNVKEVFVGFNFTFGKNGKGNSFKLQELGQANNFNVNIIGPIKYGDEIISSSKIRNYILEGNIKKANIMLGYNFWAFGEVIKGAQIARTLGFPTANLEIENKIMPKFGVYGGFTKFNNKKYKSIINIGNNPTLKTGLTTFETNIFDLDKDLYKKSICVELVEFIRPQIHFDSIELLKNEIKKNIEYWKNKNN